MSAARLVAILWLDSASGNYTEVACLTNGFILGQDAGAGDG